MVTSSFVFTYLISLNLKESIGMFSKEIKKDQKRRRSKSITQYCTDILIVQLL